MKISTKTRYVARILIELTLHRDVGPIPVSRIAMAQKIPVKYLEQLLRQLRQAGFLRSVRGPKGGHILIRDPESITLGEIVRAFETQRELVSCISCPEQCDMVSSCLVREAWADATRALHRSLDQVRISDLAAQSQALVQ